MLFLFLFWFLRLRCKLKRLPKIRYLLVTAHPDDECLFFAPTIMNHSVHLLCLSSNLERKKELLNSCRLLQIQSVSCSHFQDGEDWSLKEIREVVQDYFTTNNLDAILTFDDYGVSNHKNHCSISLALRDLDVYRLKTYSKLVKFLPFSFYGSGLREQTSNLAFNACLEHKSQITWYRVLYVMFSRYMFINDYAHGLSNKGLAFS